ncbi:hypothetical protein LBMAG34_3950 [Candidatus Saccharibacteria bacterium]|nr:hypothetical protein LBMAG34_3950 [Candidatus Saccharibacteria bacterium]
MASLPFWKSFGNMGALRNIETHQERKVREHARTDILITRVSLADQMGEECHKFLDNAQKALDKGYVEPAHISRLINFLREGAYPGFLVWTLVALTEAKSRDQRESIIDLARSNASVNSKPLARA